MIKTLIVGLVATLVFSANLAHAEDKIQEAPLTHEQVERSKVVKHLLKVAEENNDAVLFMAAAKLIDAAGPVAIVKRSAQSKDPEKIVDADLWTASALYGQAAAIAGKNSDLGKQAVQLASETMVKSNAEGCWGYAHYHTYWWYDQWGNYHERTVNHYC
jgi:hypothetical protein